MYHLVIGVPTYKRPDMLKKLISSIYACSIDPHLIKKVDIILVDNDIDQTALPLVPKFKLNCPTGFTMAYYNYFEKGLSGVRNKLIDLALELSPDFLVFVDDDEYVVEDWLNELLTTQINTGADLVKGPNKPIFEGTISNNIEHWYHTKDFENETQINFVETNNLLIKVPFLVVHGLRFDPRFDTTGGEDTFFGVECLKKGAKIIWSKKAVVYETIPEKRSRINWLLKRKYRGATTYTYILGIEKSYARLLKKFLVSIAYIFLGIIALPMQLLPVKLKYFGIIKLFEGMGGLAGLFGIRYNEYAKNELVKISAKDVPTSSKKDDKHPSVKVVVGIPTYKRPVLLEKLIRSILANDIGNTRIASIDLIIVDNDVDRSAANLVGSLVKEFNNRLFGVHYYNYPEKGLALVRNEILKRAFEYNPDYILCIDDDEHVNHVWLKEIIDFAVDHKADVLVGNVIPVFETKVPKSIATWFYPKVRPDQKTIGFDCSTGNLTLRTEYIKKHALNFDLRFNKTGAEDTFFGIQAEKKGGKCLLTNKGPVFETVPASRASLDWILKRKFRSASTYMQILKIEKKYGLIARKIVINVMYFFLGLIGLVMLPFEFENRYTGIVKLAESLGGFAGLLNINYEEYS